MERMISGRLVLICASLFFTLHVCLASVSVKVTPTVDVLLGQTARLPCSFSTTGKIAVVQWFIESSGTRKRVAFRSSTDYSHDNDTPLADRVTMETDMTLVISPVKVVDQRSFFCQVDGGIVGTSEAETKLMVFFEPEKPLVSDFNNPIPLTPDAQSKQQVGKCTSHNGHPEPRIVWFKDSKPLPEETDAKQMTYMIGSIVKESSGLFTVMSSLYITPSKMDAKSVFHCTVEYSMPNGQIKQKDSSHFNLTLLYPAQNVFFKLLNELPIKEGDEVRMKCETDGNPQPHFEFSKNGKASTSENGLYSLPNVNRSDAGTYNCEALDFDADPEDIMTKSLTFDVEFLDPVSVEPATPLMINKGEFIELQCKTRSSSPYTVTWIKDGKQVSQKGVLSLQNANLDNAGMYVCIASVPTVPGLQKQANVSVIVSGAPEIDEPMTGKVTKQGDMVTLNCSAKGYPAPQFTWKPSGKESLKPMGNQYISTITLEASEAVLKDGVICEANNVHGADRKKFLVEIQSDNRINPNNNGQADTQQGGSQGVVVAVLVCVLLLLLLVAALYFFGKRGKMACRKKQKEEESGEVKKMERGENHNEGGLLIKPRVEQ